MLTSGKELWNYEAGGDFQASFAIADGKLVIGNTDGTLYCFGKKIELQRAMATDTVKTEVGSYFVSNYPPFSQWTAEQLDDVNEALHSPPADVPLGLVPAHSVLSKAVQVLLLQGLHRQEFATRSNAMSVPLSQEIELVSKLPAMGDRPFRFVYFGGGTPSFLSGKQLTRLVDRLQREHQLGPGRRSDLRVRTRHAQRIEGPHATRTWASRD